jgi:prepilin-type N-terminal cleavage/methylation domain-containing protein
MLPPKLKSKKGFSLLETVFAIVILALILTPIPTLLQTIATSAKNILSKDILFQVSLETIKKSVYRWDEHSEDNYLDKDIKVSSTSMDINVSYDVFYINNKIFSDSNDSELFIKIDKTPLEANTSNLKLLRVHGVEISDQNPMTIDFHYIAVNIGEASIIWKKSLSGTFPTKSSFYIDQRTSPCE